MTYSHNNSDHLLSSNECEEKLTDLTMQLISVNTQSYKGWGIVVSYIIIINQKKELWEIDYVSCVVILEILTTANNSNNV